MPQSSGVLTQIASTQLSFYVPGQKKMDISLQDLSSILHLIEAYEHRRNSEVNLKSLFGFRKNPDFHLEQNQSMTFPN